MSKSGKLINSEWSFNMQEEENSDGSDDELDSVSPLQLFPLVSASQSKEESNRALDNVKPDNMASEGGWRVFGRRSGSKRSRDDDEGSFAGSSGLARRMSRNQGEAIMKGKERTQLVKQANGTTGVQLGQRQPETRAEPKREWTGEAFTGAGELLTPQIEVGSNRRHLSSSQAE